LLTPDIIVSEPNPGRGPKAGFVNERALLEMVEAAYARVHSALQDGRFPVLYGGDCSVLLGAVPAVRDTYGNAGLLFVDGHEDATTLEASTTGEAANMEIALLATICSARGARSVCPVAAFAGRGTAPLRASTPSVASPLNAPSPAWGVPASTATRRSGQSDGVILRMFMFCSHQSSTGPTAIVGVSSVVLMATARAEGASGRWPRNLWSRRSRSAFHTICSARGARSGRRRHRGGAGWPPEWRPACQPRDPWRR
jgi:Arginase family